MKDTFLARLANIVVLIVCIGIVEVATTHYNRAKAQHTVAPYRVGDQIGNTSALNLGSARSTLVLATASTCHFCSESMPFYGKLTAAARESGVRVLGATMESPEENRAYLGKHGVAVESIVSIDDNALKISRTPTILLIHNDGKIVGLWAGRLDSQREKGVLEAIRQE